ncbi:hypothetical protein Rsub_03977 [Raphidocelis subcapitata]|uniref:Uncharacterized protein n=1 Tax=Raphidocelis subcapitata TaxID=307507 RepID=A0A2V0P1G1_9CHLO|nr:hypothetical protein Rsub_03977 [Raphidocelis subcapitata]|eukprot:GBF91673.1 hypothetical protein Rsub_03977 [Raphidocelis subcapitata]
MDQEPGRTDTGGGGGPDAPCSGGGALFAERTGKTAPLLGGGWRRLDAERLRASLEAGGCDEQQLAAAAEVVGACLSCLEAAAAATANGCAGPDSGSQDDQAADACACLVVGRDVCQLAAAACKNLSEACGCGPDAQPPQQPQPGPTCPAAAARFAAPCLRLANAVLARADVAARLVEAGAHAAAAEAAKGGLKHLVAALEALAAAHLAGGCGGCGEARHAELSAAVVAACQQLLDLALAAAAVMSERGLPGAPREMASLAVLNLGWTSLGRLLTAAAAVGAPVPPAVVAEAAGVALERMVRAAGELRQPGQEARLRLARFWLSAAIKALGASRAAARGAGAWGALAGAALELHEWDRAGFAPHEAAAAAAVREMLLPKLHGAMLGALNEPGAPRAELAALLQHIWVASQSSAPDCAGGGAAAPGSELRAQAGALLAAALLQHASDMQADLAVAAARELLPGMLRAAASGAAVSLLAEHPEGLWRHARCAALTFVLGCAVGGPALEEARRAAIEQLQLQAVSSHPLVARLASQVLCGALQACSPAALEQQLGAALDALEELAAAEALRACRLDPRGPALRAALHLAAALQACSGSPAARGFAQNCLLAAAPPPADACAAAALAARVLVARFAQLPPAPYVVCFFGKCLDQALAQLGPVLSWLQRQRQQQGQQQALPPVEQMLLEAHAGWLLEVVQLAAQQLQEWAGSDAAEAVHAATGASMQQAASAARAAIELAASSPPAAEAPVGRYAAPALRLLAAAGSVLQAPALDSLLEPLGRLMQAAHSMCQQQQQQQPQEEWREDGQALLVDLAGAAGCLGGAQAQPQALFRALLSLPAWPARAAALDALVRYCRTSAVHGSFLGLIPPACMASPSAASPAFVEVFKAHMGRAPDDGARRAHGEWLAAAGPSRLARRLASRAAPGAGPGAAAPLPSGLEPLLRSCLEQRQAAAAHLSQLESSIAPLAADAKAALSGLTQALPCAEAAVGRLLSGARGAGPLLPEERALLAGQAGQLLGDLASVASRVRGLRDALEAMRDPRPAR